jgi:hypothetical protein
VNHLLVKGWVLGRVEEEQDDVISSSFWKDFDRNMSLNLRTEFGAQVVKDMWKVGFPLTVRNHSVKDEIHSGIISKRYWSYLKMQHFHAVVPLWSLPGDWICSFVGGAVFYVIRPADGECTNLTFIGEAYVFGEMDNLYQDGLPKTFILK